MDDSITMRDPNLEARAANTAYAQARAMLESDPEISAGDLVEGLRQRAEELAARAEAGHGTTAAPAPRASAPRDPVEPGLGAAAAAARERADGGLAS